MGIILLLIFILPFIAISRSRKKKEQSFITALNSLAEKSNCNITEYETWHNRAIGIDKNAHKLFFLQRTDNYITEKEINLTETEKCHAEKTNRTMKQGKETYSVIEKLELAFQLRDKQQSETLLEFYNVEKDSLTPAEELRLLEKWLEISKSSIANAKLSQLK